MVSQHCSGGSEPPLLLLLLPVSSSPHGSGSTRTHELGGDTQMELAPHFVSPKQIGCSCGAAVVEVSVVEPDVSPVDDSVAVELVLSDLNAQPALANRARPRICHREAMRV